MSLLLSSTLFNLRETCSKYSFLSGQKYKRNAENCKHQVEANSLASRDQWRQNKYLFLIDGEYIKFVVYLSSDVSILFYLIPDKSFTYTTAEEMDLQKNKQKIYSSRVNFGVDYLQLCSSSTLLMHFRAVRSIGREQTFVKNKFFSIS